MRIIYGKLILYDTIIANSIIRLIKQYIGCTFVNKNIYKTLQYLFLILHKIMLYDWKKNHEIRSGESRINTSQNDYYIFKILYTRFIKC